MEQEHKIYHSHRAEPYFTFVKNGVKTIEGRIKKGKYQDIIFGDHIIIHNEEETENFEVVVLDVRPYSSFREMLEKESLKKVLPNVSSVSGGVKIYKKFYSSEQEKEFGVVAIEIERIVPSP
jgi:ASC-1-like (ASCH) protein